MAARDRRMGVLNELIGAVSWTFIFAVAKRGNICIVVMEYEFIRDYGAEEEGNGRDLDDTYADFALLGQVYQVFRMGGSVDRACARCEGCRDEVDDQRSVLSPSVQTHFL